MNRQQFPFGELWRKEDEFRVAVSVPVLQEALDRALQNGVDQTYIRVVPHLFKLANNRIAYDPIRHSASVDGKPYQPGMPRSTRLLGVFSMQPDVLIGRDDLVDILHLPPTSDPGSIIDTAIFDVRRHLPPDLSSPKNGVIRTVFGQGYIGLSKM